MILPYQPITVSVMTTSTHLNLRPLPSTAVVSPLLTETLQIDTPRDPLYRTRCTLSGQTDTAWPPCELDSSSCDTMTGW